MVILVFTSDGDTAEAASCVDVDGVLAFFGRGFAVVGKAAEDKTGFQLDFDVTRDDDVDTAEESESFNDGVFFEFGVSEIELGTAEDRDEIGALEDFVFFVNAVTAGEDGY